MAEVQYTTRGQGALNTVLGAVGTAAGVFGNGGLSNLFGGGNPEDRPVTRYEMSLIREGLAKDAEIAALKTQLYTDGRIAGVQAEISAQAVWNATQNGVMGLLQNQVTQLMGLAKYGIPEASVTVSAFSAAPAGTAQAA